MDILIAPGTPLAGSLSVPPDKAIGHRVALLSALSTQTVVANNWPDAEDCRRTLRLIAHLGVPVEERAGSVRIQGVGLEGLRSSAEPIDCGESGTTMRLACGLLAGQPFRTRLTAAPSLGRRPMRRVVDPLNRMGASITGASSESGLPDVLPPLTIEGRRPLTGLMYRMPLASAQVKSALLIAGLAADKPTSVVEPAQTRDHTERMLSRLGVTVRRDGPMVTVEPTSRLTAPEALTIPGDFSSAAFLIVAATIVPGSRLVLRGVGLNPTRWHLLSVLRRMGASIAWTLDEQEQGWEPSGTITAASAPLTATAVTAEDVPLMIDELPILMVAAAAADGQTSFEGLAELRVKETDRLQSMVAGLSRMGATLAPRGLDGLVIDGGSLLGADVDSFGDHRTAMSLAVAGLAAEGSSRIQGAECVRKSFGSFFDLLAQVTSPETVRAEGADARRAD